MPSTSNRENADSPQQQGHTPDTVRNDKAKWKDRDQPDSDPERNHADPERDYPRPDGSE
ncbi:hypothetical protein [Xanthomonas bundabergensis]|uniref:hypothetical protein n=1 Tax=Xanthomonas bundabergensis TaxID=3160842 RepID=UPI003511090C